MSLRAALAIVVVLVTPVAGAQQQTTPAPKRPSASGAEPPAARLVDPIVPRPVHHAVDCQDVRGCRIDCFQNGVNVASRSNITQHDAVTLVMYTGAGGEIISRWLEIRSFDEARIRTFLLPSETLCDFHSMTIGPGQVR